MIRGNTPIYKTYAAETEPIYAHLDNPDAPTPTAAQIKADIITAWDGLWNAIDTRTFVNDVLGVKTDDAVSEADLEKQYRFITCLYPEDTKDIAFPCLGLAQSTRKRWQALFSRAIQDNCVRVFLDPKLSTASPALMSLLRDGQLKGGTSVFNACPFDETVQLRNDTYTDFWLTTLNKPNPRFALVTKPGTDCLLQAKTSGNTCGNHVDDRHLSMCKTQTNVPIEIHDEMVKWIAGELTLLNLTPKITSEPRNACHKESSKRPADLLWLKVHRLTYLEGLDYCITDPRSHPIAAKTTGSHVAKAEASKLKNISTLSNRAIRPFCVGFSGGLGKEALGVLREFSKIAHPGNDNDPEIRQRRGVYRTRFTIRHAFALARARYFFKCIKFDQIRDARLYGKYRVRTGVRARTRYDVEANDACERAAAKSSTIGAN